MTDFIYTSLSEESYKLYQQCTQVQKSKFYEIKQKMLDKFGQNISKVQVEPASRDITFSNNIVHYECPVISKQNAMPILYSYFKNIEYRDYETPYQESGAATLSYSDITGGASALIFDHHKLAQAVSWYIHTFPKEFDSSNINCNIVCFNKQGNSIEYNFPENSYDLTTSLLGLSSEIKSFAEENACKMQDFA